MYALTIGICSLIWLNIRFAPHVVFGSLCTDAMNAWAIPQSSQGKRPASRTLGPVSKAGRGDKIDRQEIVSVGSVQSEAPPLGAPLAYPKSTMKSPGQSQIEDLDNMGITEYMLMLLLQNSRRLADLQSTTYYTHMLPTDSPLYRKLNDTYQSYLHAVQQSKDHQLGPPMIHRYTALLEFLSTEETLRAKSGLAPLMATLDSFLNELKNNPTFTEIESVVDAYGHCKIHKAYDQSVVKILFVGPHLVRCGEALTTLGSVTSRLLRSVKVPRKNGTAPMGHMERQLQAALQARQGKRDETM